MREDPVGHVKSVEHDVGVPLVQQSEFWQVAEAQRGEGVMR
jgi:hypothetical protein